LAKFFPANQTLPKLAKFMGQLWQSFPRRIKLCQSLRSLWVSFGKVHPVDAEFAKVGGIDDSALANRAAFRVCNKVIIS